MSESLTADCANYRSHTVHNGKYRFRKVLLNNIANATITTSATSQQLLEFKFPANTVINLSRSVLEYTIACASNAKANFIFNDTTEIVSSIQFGDASGQYLCDMQYAANYVQCARRADTNLQDYLTNDLTSGLNKIDVGAVVNIFPPSFATSATGNLYGLANSTTVLTGISGTEAQYVRATAAVNASTLTRTLSLSAFTDTCLAQDTDMIFPTDMYLRIMLAPSNKIGFMATAATDPTTGAAAFAVQPTIQNLALQLAVQVDETLRSRVIEKFNSPAGLTFQIPFQYGWKFGSTTTGAVSNQVQLTSQYGMRCKRIMYVPYNSVETTNTALDHCNFDGAKITSYQTFLDSVPLEDYPLSCLQPTTDGTIHGLDDWKSNYDYLNGSAYTNSANYQLNWVHFDSFSNPKRGSMLLPENLQFEGIDLSMPRTWSVTATCKIATLNHFIFGSFIRQVHTSSAGMTVNVR